MGGLSPWHLLILLVIVVLVFGTRKIGNMGADLGHAVNGFKDGMRDGEHPEDDVAPSQRVPDKTTIDVEAREKTK